MCCAVFPMMTDGVVAALYSFWQNERAAIAMKFPGDGHHPMQPWCALE
jgi:hypothetical protein